MNRHSIFSFAFFLLFGMAVQAQQKGCDTAIEQHVFNQTRFKVLADCITVTGVVKGLLQGKDGDLHIALKPDTAYLFRLNANNLSKWDSCLVCEIVCQHTPDSTAGVGDICKGYLNNIQPPDVGDHISVSGRFVQDTGEGILGYYGWNEIHPVTGIKYLQKASR